MNPLESALSLPAETTTTEPAATARLMAACSVASQAPTPRSDKLMTSAGFRFAGAGGTLPPYAQTMASEMSEMNPPHLPSTRSGSTLALNATPATPLALLVTAAIVPATWVPCQLELVLPGKPHSESLLQSPGSFGSVSRPSPSLAENVSLMKS